MGLKLICHDDSQAASDSVERALLISAEGYTTLTTWAARLQTSKKIAHRLRSISWQKEPVGWVIVQSSGNMIVLYNGSWQSKVRIAPKVLQPKPN